MAERTVEPRTRRRAMDSRACRRSLRHPHNGARVDYNKAGKPTSITTRSGAAARYDSRGHVSTIRSGGMTINHAGHGGRTIVTERGDHSRLVSMGHGRGYSERGYSRGGHEYRNRTYYYTAATTREPTGATTITAIATTATCRDTIILRDFMAGPTTRGARRSPMAGAGADRRGTARMDITSRRTRATRARPSG